MSSNPQTAQRDPFDLGGETLSSVPPDYRGPCRVTLHSQSGRSHAVVIGTEREAERVATYAASYPNGGYAKACMDPAPAQVVDFALFEDWLVGN